VHGGQHLESRPRFVADSYLTRTVDKPKELKVSMKIEKVCIGACIHLDGTQRAQVGLEDILETLAGADVDPESFPAPL